MGLLAGAAVFAPAPPDHQGGPLSVAAEPEPPAVRRSELAALLLAAALMPLNSTMIAVAIPAIGADLGHDTAALTGALVSSYLLAGIVLQGPAGKLADRVGYGRALAAGQALFAAGAAVGFFARSLPALTAARVLMACGGAVVGPSVQAILRNRVPAERRARTFGLFGASMGLSAALGPLVGGELTSRFGWPLLFVANLPPIAAWLVLSRGAPAAARPPEPRPFDVAGALLLGSGLGLVIVGLRDRPGRGAALAAAGALALGAFFVWERRARDPVLDPALFRLRAFAAGSAVIGLQNLAMYAALFELPQYLAASLGTSPREAGRALLALMGTMVVVSPIGGRASEKIGARASAALGSSVAIAGALGLALRTPSSASSVAPWLALMGAGLALSTAPAQAAALGAVEGRHGGMAAGAMSIVRYVGGVVGVALVASLSAGAGVEASHARATAIFVVALAGALAASLAMPGRQA